MVWCGAKEFEGLIVDLFPQDGSPVVKRLIKLVGLPYAPNLITYLKPRVTSASN